MTSTEINNILKNIVKEDGIVNIIMSNKKDMEIEYIIQKRKEMKRYRRKLERELNETKDNLRNLEKQLKETCDHEDVREDIYPGWDRSEHTYTCNICRCYVRIHKEFSYKNITNTFEH